MMENTIFADILNKLELGSLTAQVKRVSGGYMHKMYSLETETGKYAVKLLNPIIMQREDVFKNYEIAERLEKILQINDIPIIPALEFGGKKMQCINNQYFYIFDWACGKALSSEEIKKEHCQTIGAILARIHKIEQRKEMSAREEIKIDWDFYIKLSNEKCPEIIALLIDNRELLYDSQKEGNLALKSVPPVISICNGDMDSKNVLWFDDNPQIIDLECLSYGNPYMELFQLALYWSGYENCSINYEHLISFITAYCQEYGKLQVDWDVLYKSNFGILEWLEYNVKRALMIECENEEERLLGIDQVKQTIKHIIYYDLIHDELLGRLNKEFN